MYWRTAAWSLQLVCAVTLALIETEEANAVTYDVVDQFSVQVNSNSSRWSYRFNTTGIHDNDYTLMTVSGDLPDQLGAFLKLFPGSTTKETVINAKFPCWYTPNGPSITPDFCVNRSNNNGLYTYSIGTTLMATQVFPAQHLSYHPPATGLSAVSFLAPRGGDATIAYDFTPINYACQLPGGPGSQGIVWSVDLNTETMATGTLLTTSPTDIATTGNQTLTVAVRKDDRINFIIAPNKGDPLCDTTVLTATITLP